MWKREKSFVLVWLVAKYFFLLLSFDVHSTKTLKFKSQSRLSLFALIKLLLFLMSTIPRWIRVFARRRRCHYTIRSHQMLRLALAKAGGKLNITLCRLQELTSNKRKHLRKVISKERKYLTFQHFFLFQLTVINV